MSLIGVLILGVGLSMDAFAVSIAKGLALKKITWSDRMKAGLWFGIFQGAMPFAGWLLGSLFAGYIETFSSWVAFGLLAYIGGNMIWEAYHEEDEDVDDAMGWKPMLLLAIATSIDAMAAGLTFAMVPVEILKGSSALLNTFMACCLIALETGVFSAVGISIGSLLGARFQKKAQVAGGIILILLGVRILLGMWIG